MPYKNEHAVRVNDPNKYVKFARKEIADGISIIIGWTEDGKSEVQAYRFDKDKFTVEEVEKWLKEHKIEGKVEEAKEMNFLELEGIKQTQEEQDILVFPRGKFYIEHLNDWIEFNNEFFKNIMENFTDTALSKPFIDKQHEKGESYGDILSLEIKEDGLHAKIKLNENGIEAIKGREFRYISPWFGNFTDINGKEHKNVLFSISLTNIPALGGAYRELQEQIQLEAKRMEKIKEQVAKLGKIALENKWVELEAFETDENVITLLETVYSKLAELNELNAQIEKVLQEKAEMEKQLNETKEQLTNLEQANLERDAKETIKLAIEQGKYPASLFELKVEQYKRNKDEVVKELSLIPAKQKATATSSVNAQLTDDDIRVMQIARLDPQNPRDVELYLKNKK
ncbi:MAG: hypothetical protein GYA51_03375 [Candidatus Methanofastidiosa archaeon]|nr:hypothetical protein [Candidatus Methanofastidiosa archaeon]